MGCQRFKIAFICDNAFECPRRPKRAAQRLFTTTSAVSVGRVDVAIVKVGGNDRNAFTATAAIAVNNNVTTHAIDAHIA